MRRRSIRSRFLREERGATAVEFALVIGFAVAAVLGIINGGLLFYSYANLHMAAENTARWASIRATVDGVTPASVQAEGEGYYLGATAEPTFTVADAACGVQVTASATFSLMLGLGSAPVEMNAAACQPLG
jgi:Flp pilus assembly pilin Flp